MTSIVKGIFIVALVAGLALNISAPAVAAEEEEGPTCNVNGPGFPADAECCWCKKWNNNQGTCRPVQAVAGSQYTIECTTTLCEGSCLPQIGGGNP